MNKKRWFISGFILAVISIFTIAATDKSVFDQAKLQALLTKITGVLNFDSNTLVVDATNNRVGVGTNAPTNLLHVNAADGVMDNSYAGVIQNSEITAGRNYGLLVIGGSNASDTSFNVADKSGSTDYFAVKGDGSIQQGNTAIKFQSLNGYKAVNDATWTTIINTGDYFNMRLAFLCYGSSSRTTSGMYDFSVLVGSPSTYDLSGFKVVGVNSVSIQYGTNIVQIYVDTADSSGVNCTWHAEGMDRTTTWTAG